MTKKKFLSSSLLLIAMAVGVTTAFGQGRYANVYNRVQVEQFVQQLENSSDAFHNDFRRVVDNSRFNSSTRRQYTGYAEQFENAVDRLRSRFDSSDSWWESRNEVRAMIANSQNLNTTMNVTAFRRGLEQQWNRLRNDVNKLADTYDLPGLNGGGWGGGGGGYPGAGGNVPSWATGTFYGRDRQTGSLITLTIARNGSVTVSVDGSSLSYASLNGTTLTNGPYVSRVTRRNNGIRTTDINDGNNFIDYSKNRNTGGGNWNPGGGGQGNVPNWAIGNFYGNDSLSGSNIALSIQQNGQVLISINGGSPIYASLNGTTLTNGADVSRITRINNGIRTTDVNNRNRFIDYYRR